MPLKVLFIFAGTLSLVLGVLGIFVPGLPTTPFLLLTAGLYARGSERLYRMLVSNKYLGHYIHRYRSQKGITKRVKIRSIILMWVMIGISTVFFIQSLPVRLIVIIVGVVGTAVMGFIIPTYRGSAPCEDSQGISMARSGRN